MSDRKRVLCAAGWWPKGDQVAGIFIREHVRAIALYNDVEVIHVEVRRSKLALPRMEVDSYLDHGLPVHWVVIHTPLRRFGAYEFLVRRAYTRLLDRLGATRAFDLFHIHVRTIETEQLLRLDQWSKVPVLLTEHNSYYHLGIRRLPPDQEVLERRRIRQWLADPRIIKITPVSQDLSRVLNIDFGVEEARLEVIPNVAHEAFKPKPKPPTFPFRILLAAVWRPPKDPEVFIKAMALLPPELTERCIVQWVGYGPDHERIRQQWQREVPHIAAEFSGMLGKEDLAGAMQKAHLFILPTLADNQPCVILESHCTGTPVISMKVNGVPEMIDDENGILVPPSDPQALAKAITDIMLAKKQFHNEHIAWEAIQRYSIPKVGERFDKMYDELLRRRIGVGA